MTTGLILYSEACRAVEAARTIDEVKEIVGRAEAARAYAHQVKNRQLEIDAMEIRVRAERRLGEIILELKADGAPRSGRQGTDMPTRVTLSDLGIDHNVSVIAQRVALLPLHRFDAEMTAWRLAAFTSQRLQAPLHAYRRPTSAADRDRARSRKGRIVLEANDPLAKFRAPDGRRVADWRIGELERLAATYRRALQCAEMLQAAIPVANADALATVEMIFTPAQLQDVLAAAWDSLPQGNMGLQEKERARQTAARQRICQNPACGKSFETYRAIGPAVAARGEGRYCSRSCAAYADRATKRSQRSTGSEAQV